LLETATKTFYDRKVTQLSGKSLSIGCDNDVSESKEIVTRFAAMYCIRDCCNCSQFDRNLVEQWV